MLNQQQLKQAVKLHEQGKHAEAGALYQKLHKSDPKNPHVVHFQALLAGHTGNDEEAIRLFRQAIKLNPTIPDFHRNLSLTLVKLGRQKEAAGIYSDLGNALQQQAKFKEAIVAYDESLKLAPNNPGVTANRMAAEQRLGNGADAEAGYRKVISRLRGRARSVRDYLTLGNAYQALDENERALAAFDKALALEPGCAHALYNSSFILLMNGDLEKGLKAHEMRWSPEVGYVEQVRCGFTQPVWRNETPEQLSGNLLVVAEQGYGDTIHFARYVPLLAEQGHKILFEVQPNIVSLFAEGLAHPNIRVIPRLYYRWDKWHLGWLARKLKQPLQKAGPTEIFRDLPFKAWVGLLSLPERFGTTLENIPAAVPYLTVPPAKARQWAQKLATSADRLKIGIVWSGDPRHADDYKRSIKFRDLLPVLQRQAQFYSLQLGIPKAQLEPRDNLTDLSAHLSDFSVTAAIVENLDLVITIDSAVAHLAGALNKPVWIIMPQAKDWRWLKERSDSPWYPSARLFRQHQPGKWAGAIEDVGKALDEKIAAYNS